MCLEIQPLPLVALDVVVPTCHGDPILSKMGTQWGPDFESDGDLMGTSASRNGDSKSVFLKIDRNKQIS